LRSNISHAADKARSHDFQSGVSETLSRTGSKTLQTTSRAAQQAAVDARLVCRSHAPKATAAAAAAAGAAKDTLAKASHGFAGIFRRSQVAPTCPHCMSSTEWTDYCQYAGGGYALGWTCANLSTCGSCSQSHGPWRWFCTVCQTYDLCGNCVPKDVRSPPRKISDHIT
jgi:hypothetical protein